MAEKSTPLNRGNVLLYQTEDGQTDIDVHLHEESVWSTQAQMAELFQQDQSVISRQVNNVFGEGELPKQSNMQKMHIALSD
ncbi:MAG: death-on-curing protein [Desulfoprunum sp.]